LEAIKECLKYNYPSTWQDKFIAHEGATPCKRYNIERNSDEWKEVEKQFKATLKKPIKKI
jgi:hypothetical protein